MRSILTSLKFCCLVKSYMTLIKKDIENNVEKRENTGLTFDIFATIDRLFMYFYRNMALQVYIRKI